MSDLGAIFHVKKAGVQYDAHAYTTLDECPFPNLKIKFRGQQAYVKMEQGKGNGDVPCYAKDKAGVIYQVRKYAIPTGQIAFGRGSTITLKIPAGIKVLQFVTTKYADGSGYTTSYYIGVTPGTSHTFHTYSRTSSHFQHWYFGCNTHTGLEIEAFWEHYWLKWSPEINKHAVDYSHYET